MLDFVGIVDRFFWFIYDDDYDVVDDDVFLNCVRVLVIDILSEENSR